MELSTRIFLIFGLLISQFVGYSQDLIILKDGMPFTKIGRNISYLEDPGSSLSFHEIQQAPFQNQFKPCQVESPNFQSTSSSFWLKFKISSKSKERFFIDIGSSFIDQITVFELDDGGTLISKRESGDELAFDHREIQISNFTFEIKPKINKIYTYYIRVNSAQPLFFPLRVGSYKNVIEHAHKEDFIQGLYFGFMILILLYNLFLYVSIRENIYLYYVAYVLSMTSFMAAVNGFMFEYLWPTTPWINEYVVVFAGLTMITATLFTQQFLHTKEKHPKLHLGTHTFTVLGAVTCILTFTDFYTQGLLISQIGLLLMAVCYLYLGIQFNIQGYKPASFYLLAWGVLLVGIIAAILESLNIVPVMDYVNAMQIGSAAEVLLLSFALGEKINDYKLQKDEAQVFALSEIEKSRILTLEQNSILEQKVHKRTKEIAMRNDELVNLNKEKDTLMGVVAHDLRTPLNQIKGFIHLISMSENNLNQSQIEFLNEMNTSADRLTQMTSRILDLNAIEAKKINLKIDTYNISNIVNNVLKYFKTTAKEKGIEIHFTVNGDNHFANIDKNYLIQVLENLVSNAVKFCSENSQINLRVLSEEGMIQIEVEDDGPGISQEDQKLMFKRYQTLSARPTGGESSTGLGLSIAKKYIEAMNGEIYCVSQEGRGTKFILNFDTEEYTPSEV
ncbi:MAG: sensor histidine kinase [Reichenbachiella sp.]